MSFFWGCRTQRKIGGYSVPDCVRGKKILMCSGLDDFTGLNVIDGELGDEDKFEGVKLILNQTIRKFCSGVFVKRNIMIAPAQCFLAKPLDQNQISLVKIRSISKERAAKFQIVAIPSKVIINPAYKQSVLEHGARSIRPLAFDLAVVVFRKPVVRKNQVFNLIKKDIPESTSLAWVGHGLPGIWSTSELWRRRKTVKVANSKFDPNLIEVDYSLRITEQMKAKRANIPVTSGSVLLSNRKAVGLFVGYSFQKYAFIFNSNKRILFNSFNNPINEDFLKNAIAESLLINTPT